jgi:putative ATP-binding cassette transporter
MIVILCRQLFSAPLGDIEEIGPARILSTLTEDVAGVTNGLTAVPTIGLHAAIVGGCLGYMAWLSATVFWIVFTSVAGAVSVYFAVSRKANPFFQRAREHRDGLFEAFRGLTYGIKELQLNVDRREAFLKQTIELEADHYRRDNLIASTIHCSASSAFHLLLLGGVGAIVFLLPMSSHTSMQAIAGCAFAAIYLVNSVSVITSLLPELVHASIAVNRIQALGFALGQQHVVPPASGATSDEVTSWRSLSLDSVSHFYQTEDECSDFVLGPLDFELKRGEIVFLVGANGSGKTTFAKILTSLYPPGTGQVLLDGRRITEHTLDKYRALFSVVFADPFIFRSLEGLKTPNLDRVATQYLRLLWLDHKITVSNGRLSTISLSHGQQKRIALLWAYLEDRPIYLLDEPAADQDASFKHYFYSTLLPELKARGKTVIVISHDDRYFNSADRVIKLESGQVRNESLNRRG